MAKRRPKRKTRQQKNETIEKDLGLGSIIRELKKLEEKPFVKVGFPAEFKSGKTQKTFTDINEASGGLAGIGESDSTVQTDPNVTVLDAAIWNEFGTESIPERSFVRSAFDKNRAKYEKQTKKLLIKIYKSEMSVERALDILGLMLETDIKDMIRNGQFEPLSINTVIRKGSDKPLIDTAQMLNSVRFKRIMRGASRKILGKK